MKKIITLLGVFLVGSLTSLGIVYAIENVADPFPDVNYNDYYGDSLIEMQERDIISGYADGNFGPNDPVTRAQLVTILDRYEQSILNWNYPGKTTDLLLILCDGIDRSDISSDAQNAYDDLCVQNVLL